MLTPLDKIFLLCYNPFATKNQKEDSTLSTKEFLNFKEISSKIRFEDVLNWLNIPFQTKGTELKGDGFIVSTEKNLFFSKDKEGPKGSVINFVAHRKHLELRAAASLLKSQFLIGEKVVTPKRDIPDLELLWDSYIQERGINPEIAKEYEVGFVSQRSIIAGRIAVKMYDREGNHIGYIGFKKEDGTWFFPKGFIRPLYNSHRLSDTNAVIITTDPFDALRIVSLDIPYVVSLLAYSMTPTQEEQLKKFKYILLLHKEPLNITSRLCSTSFIKAPTLLKPLKDMSDEELLSILKPSS